MKPVNRKEIRDWLSEKVAAGVVDSILAVIVKIYSFINIGPIKWITEWFIEYIWDKSGDKALRFVLRKGWLIVDKASGELRLKKIRKAKDEEDSDNYWSTISDI